MTTADKDALAKQALNGWLRMQLFLAVMLFLPAWSLHWWQGWLYWAVLGVSLLWNTLYFLRHDPALVRRRLQAGPKAEILPSQKRIQAVTGILVMLTILLPGFDHHFNWSAVPGAAVLAANAAVALGLYLVLLTFKANSYAASTIRVEQGQPVISSGLYAYVRHPMYSGSVLMFLATPPALGSWWALLPAVALCGMLAVRLLDEERYLVKELPGYADYYGKVRWRLLPGIW